MMRSKIPGSMAPSILVSPSGLGLECLVHHLTVPGQQGTPHELVFGVDRELPGLGVDQELDEVEEVAGVEDGGRRRHARGDAAGTDDLDPANIDRLPWLAALDIAA